METAVSPCIYGPNRCLVQGMVCHAIVINVSLHIADQLQNYRNILTLTRICSCEYGPQVILLGRLRNSLVAKLFVLLKVARVHTINPGPENLGFFKEKLSVF